MGPGAVYTNACKANDIALVRVTTTDPTEGFPGSMAFGYASSSFLDGVNKYHRGYPDCGQAGDPLPAAPKICLNRTLYGDTAFSKDAGTWLSGTYPRLYAHSSDMSRGHSGGPAYYTTANKVFGVNIYETCIGSACSGTQVNTLRALDVETFEMFLTFMGF
jgi:hypothetical protein